MSTSHFLVRKSAIEKRWDPFYFQPHLVELEARVRAKAKHTLRDFTLHMAGGSTPLKSEGDQHYTTADSGIPFIRVQNLTTTGELDLQDVKHITHSTHSKLLGRSRLTGGELLVKITGVGRMAVASVVPPKVEANINQHIAAIRTASLQTSDALAAYLNLDFVEQLASRRATGGTRPALDYAALLSIPVIEDARIVSLMQSAFSEKKRLEQEARALLAKVDAVLLEHLGIPIPAKNSEVLSKRIFIRKLSEMDRRFDALFYQSALFEFLHASKYPCKPLSAVAYALKSGFAAGKSDQEFDEGVIQIRPTNINDDRQLVFERNVYLHESLVHKLSKDRLQKCEVLFNNTNSQDLVGKTVYFDMNDDYFCSNHITRIEVNPDELNPRYLAYLLNTYQRMKIFYSMCVNWNNQSGINIDALRKLPIPIPGLDIQSAVVAEIDHLEKKAYVLRQEGQKKLDVVKAQVESMILGD